VLLDVTLFDNSHVVEYPFRVTSSQLQSAGSSASIPTLPLPFFFSWIDYLFGSQVPVPSHLAMLAANLEVKVHWALFLCTLLVFSCWICICLLWSCHIWMDCLLQMSNAAATPAYTLLVCYGQYLVQDE